MNYNTVDYHNQESQLNLVQQIETALEIRGGRAVFPEPVEGFVELSLDEDSLESGGHYYPKLREVLSGLDPTGLSRVADAVAEPLDGRDAVRVLMSSRSGDCLDHCAKCCIERKLDRVVRLVSGGTHGEWKHNFQKRVLVLVPAHSYYSCAWTAQVLSVYKESDTGDFLRFGAAPNVTLEIKNLHSAATNHDYTCDEVKPMSLLRASDIEAVVDALVAEMQ